MSGNSGAMTQSTTNPICRLTRDSLRTVSGMENIPTECNKYAVSALVIAGLLFFFFELYLLVPSVRKIL